MSRLVDRLDRQLAKKGADAVLRRRKGQSDQYAEVTVRVRTSGYTGTDVQANIEIQGTKFIMSPTALLKAPNWFAGGPGNIWPRRGDFIVYQGRNRSIEQCEPVAVGDEVVRIEGLIKG